MRKTLIIAIDPDADKSGVAMLDRDTRTIHGSTMTFTELLQTLAMTPKDAKVLIEAGYLNQSNWHITHATSPRKAAAMGQAVGRNHETARKLVDVCRFYSLDVEEVRPLRKIWRGRDGKITHDEITQFMQLPNRTNQEVRDAALIAWNYAGLPMKLKLK